MAQALTQHTLKQTLDWTYDKAVNGLVGLDSAADLARDYMKQKGSRRDQARNLIRWQSLKAATSGFLTGLGGVITMPVAIPASLTSVMFIQVRMVAALAVMGGHDIHDDRVKALVYICLAGNSATKPVKEVASLIGRALTEQGIGRISSSTINTINQAIGFRLLTKFGQTGAINLSKLIPVAGGVVGAGFDSMATLAVGHFAREAFVDTSE